MITFTLPPGLYTDTFPPVPTLAVTAFGMVWFATQFRLDDSGRVVALGKMVRNESFVPPVTVTFNTTASTLPAGTPPTPVTVTSRVVPWFHGVVYGPTLNGGGLESRIRAGGNEWK